MANGHADAERFMNWRTIDGKDLDPLGQFNELETQVRGALTAIPLAVEELANLINSETFFQAKKNHPCRNRGGFFPN